MSSTSKNQETIPHKNRGPSRRKVLPPGWQFNPTDEELILHFLRPKNNAQPFHSNIIHEVDLYSYSPDDLTGKYKRQGKNEWYFFTKRRQRYGTRPNRTAGNGYWKATGSTEAVLDDQKQNIIGSRRALSFILGQQSDKTLNNKTCWLMHEYQLQEEEIEASDPRAKRARITINDPRPGLQPESQGDKESWETYLLCKVYQNSKKEGKNTTEEVQQEVELRLENTRRQDDSIIQQEQEQPEVEPRTVVEPINMSSSVALPPTLDRHHGLTINALEDSQIHDNSQTRTIFEPSPISMYTDPRINILPGHYSSDEQQGAKGFDSYDALGINRGLYTSSFDELSAVFRKTEQWNSFNDDLQVDQSPPNDLPLSSNSSSVTAFDELSAIFQDQVKRSGRR